MASVRRRRDFQQLRYCVIVADHLAAHVEHDNAFAHIVCYGLEILLPALRILHLLFDLRILVSDLSEQR